MNTPYDVRVTLYLLWDNVIARLTIFSFSASCKERRALSSIVLS